MNCNEDNYTINILQGCNQVINGILKLNPVCSVYFYTLFNQNISKYSANLFEKKNLPLAKHI